MAFRIYPNQDLCNIFDLKSKLVDNLIINNGLLQLGDYYIPLDKILYIKEIA